MRVLHVMPNLSREFGGPIYSLVAYLNAASCAGISSAVAAPQCSSADEQWIRRAAPETDFHLFAGGRAFDPRVLFRVSSLLARSRRARSAPDVIHVHGLLNQVSTLAANQCTRAGWPFVVRPFGTLSRYTFTHRRPLLKRLYLMALDRPHLRSAGAVHFTTSGELLEACAHGIEFASRSHVIPPPLINPSSVPHAERSPGSFPRVLFLSRLDPKKNLEGLLAAWPMVRARVPGAQLIVAGSGEPKYVEKLRAMACSADDSSISFAGFVTGSTKLNLLASADAFVLPSYHENFGVAVLEAVAAGTPVVITAEVQLSDFIRENGLGLIADSTPGSIGRALVEILGSGQWHRRCLERGPRLVESEFSPQKIGLQLLAMYRSAFN